MKKFNKLFEEYKNSYLDESKSPCWDGYEKVSGKKDYEKGSCQKKKKKKVTESIEQNKHVYSKNFGSTVLDIFKTVSGSYKFKLSDNENSVYVNGKYPSDYANQCYKFIKYMLGMNLSLNEIAESFQDKFKKFVTESKCTKVTQKASSDRKDKKWTKCSKQPDGSVKRIHWGDPNARVTGKSGNTDRKKAFRARHNCANAKKGSAQQAACNDW